MSNHEFNGIIAQIEGARASLRAAGLANVPLKIRMHPLDIAACRRTYMKNATTDWRSPMKLLGCEIVGDCAVRRGHPIPEYADA